MIEHSDDFEPVDPGAVICPSCYQAFLVPAPPLSEVPALLDYDCEICCRPMVISFFIEDEILFSEARGLGE